jgi:MerR family transcriptional regulator, light-induced transcriptional regulator
MHALPEGADTPLYNTAAVVLRTGVAATTFRAWERRYGFPKPDRDAGGQRLYSEREIQAIQWLREQTALGVAISRAVAMLQSGQLPGEQSPEPDTARARSYAALRAELLAALLAFKSGLAETVLAEAFALYSVEDVCLEILEPLLVEVGDRWHTGELSVADEHYVTSFIRARLFALLNVYQRSDPAGPLVLTACAPDEWHEMGILLVSVFLARRHVAVRYLGPNLPLEALERVVTRHHPAVVALSAQSPDTARKLRRVARVLRSSGPPQPQFVYGGQAFNADPGLRDAVDGTWVGPTAAAASGAITAMVEGSRRPPPHLHSAAE